MDQKKLLFILPPTDRKGVYELFEKKAESLGKSGEFSLFCRVMDSAEETKTCSSWPWLERMFGEERLRFMNGDFEFKMDHVHFEEMPETFMSSELVEILYGKYRSEGSIISESVHFAEIEPEAKKSIPDKFIFHSKDKIVRYISIANDFEFIPYTNNSSVIEKTEPLPEIKYNIGVFHLLTRIEDRREQNSIRDIAGLKDFPGFHYRQCINKPFTDLPPSENCMRPESISMIPGGTLTPGHYGCYLAHKQGVMLGMESDFDYTLIFECDCLFAKSTEDFTRHVGHAVRILEENKDIVTFSFGYHNFSHILNDRGEFYEVSGYIGAHCYIIPRRSYGIFHDLFTNKPWDVTDLLYMNTLNTYKHGIFKNPVTKQSEGYSLLDQHMQNERF